MLPLVQMRQQGVLDGFARSGTRLAHQPTLLPQSFQADARGEVVTHEGMRRGADDHQFVLQPGARPKFGLVARTFDQPTSTSSRATVVAMSLVLPMVTSMPVAGDARRWRATRAGSR